MKTLILLFVIAAGTAMAQVSAPGLPVSLDLGLGGGISLPLGSLGDITNTGWNAGAKGRISGLIPINIVASAYYNRLPYKGSSDAHTAWLIGAGIELPIPSIIVKPYLGLDGLVTVVSSTATPGSTTREGVGIGGGAVVSVPFLGSVDASVKYQLLNVVGKVSNEDTISQVAATISVMFSLL